jgi:uncharacterized protein YjbI with pentapeptide repeats
MNDRSADHLTQAMSKDDASPSAPLRHPASEHLNYFHENASQKSCPVEMSDNKQCGRDLHAVGIGIDKRPVCLMHSQDPRKDTTAFWEEIKAILDGSSKYHHSWKDRFDFGGFVFLAADFSHQEFVKLANFSDATFTQCADFRAATFTKSARFWGATFSGAAKFGGATFTQDSDFSRVTFFLEAGFVGATFTEHAKFEAAKFIGCVDKSGDRVGAEFSRAKFIRSADFFAATFIHAADFSYTNFLESVSFWKATFCPFSCFTFATFTQDAEFSDAIFGETADFSYTKFGKALILDDATFGKRKEEGKVPPTPSIAPSTLSIADFSNATFENPPLVRFFQVNKGSLQGLRAKFLNCPVEQVEFTDIHWHKQWGRLVLQDEVDLYGRKREKKRTRKEEQERGRGEVEHSEGTREGIRSALEYTLVAKLYRQLISNFERNRDYDLAEDCYVGAMEMQRLEPHGSLSTRSILLIYKGLSNYGSSVPRAFLCVLLFVLILFPWLYSLTGIRLVPAQPGTTAGDRPGATGIQIALLDNLKPKEYRFRAINDCARTFASATWLSLEVATFQKNTTIEPATMAGRHIATIETIVAPGQLALFFLALRRRFRR